MQQENKVQQPIKKVFVKETKAIKQETKKIANTVIDSPVRLYDHIAGDRFSHRHKMIVGSVLMTIGVIIAKSAGEIHVIIIKICGDILGYFLHGAGATPYLEYWHFILTKRNDENKE